MLFQSSSSSVPHMVKEPGSGSSTVLSFEGLQTGSGTIGSHVSEVRIGLPLSGLPVLVSGKEPPWPGIHSTTCQQPPVHGQNAVTLVQVNNNYDSWKSGRGNMERLGIAQVVSPVNQISTPVNQSSTTVNHHSQSTVNHQIQSTVNHSLTTVNQSSIPANYHIQPIVNHQGQSTVNQSTTVNHPSILDNLYTKAQLDRYSIVTIPESSLLSTILDPNFELRTTPTDPENPLQPIIKSSLKKTSPTGVRKSVKFSASDLVHVEEYTVSPSSPPSDLFLVCGQHVDDSSLFLEDWDIPGENPDLEHHGDFWFESSTDPDPILTDFPSQDTDRSNAPLSFANDIFGRTTIFVTSGSFRPGETGKLNGKTVSDLGGSHDSRRSISAGTLSSLRSHRTLVKIDFIQGLFDLNHNPGQTEEEDSKAIRDPGSAVSSYKYNTGEKFHKDMKKTGVIEFPYKSTAMRVDKKICHKLSEHKYKLIILLVGAAVIICIAIAIGIGLGN